MKKNSENANEVNGEQFAALLANVSVEGLIEECVLKVEKGIGKVRAVDMSNSVFVSVSSPLSGLPDGVYGLGSIGTMVRYMGSFGKDSTLACSIEGSKITLSKKGHGRVSFTLLKPEEVPTAVQQENPEEKLLANAKQTFSIDKDGLDKFSSYMGLFGSQMVVVKSKNQTVSLASAAFENNSFHMRVASAKTEDFSTTVYAANLLRVIKLVLGVDEKAEVFSGEGAPVVIKSKKNLWALTPIAEG